MELEIGAIYEGKVTGITKFGAFVALPAGRSGLVHISEVAYSYVSEVSEFLTVGQEVKVKVINIDNNNRINLSIKQTLEPPPKQERSARPDRGERPQRDNNSERRSSSFERSEQSSNTRPASPRPSAPKEPQGFDDMLKQYMSESETKLSKLNRGERPRRRNNRRGGGGNGGGGGFF